MANADFSTEERVKLAGGDPRWFSARGPERIFTTAAGSRCFALSPRLRGGRIAVLLFGRRTRRQSQARRAATHMLATPDPAHHRSSDVAQSL